VPVDPKLKGYLRRSGLVIAVAMVAVVGWTGYQLWSSWHNVERVPFETESARSNLPTTTTIGAALEGANDPIVGGDPVLTPEGPDGAAAQAVNESLNAFLVIGSDQKDQTTPSRRADVILLFLLPNNDAAPILVSIPRDLYILNPCTGSKSRVNVNLNGCGARVTGPEQLAIALEDYTGITIDHFAVFSFDGFKNIIDRVGGVNICVDYPVQDLKVDPVALNLPAGCSVAQGDQALAWIRSRHTKQYLNGAWSSIPGVNDLTRNQRQQDVIIQALAELKQFTTVTEFTGVVEELSHDFAIDDGMSLTEAVSFAWNLRSLDTSTIVRPVLEVADYVDPSGAYVLIPTKSFRDVLVATDPDAADLFADSAS